MATLENDIQPGESNEKNLEKTTGMAASIHGNAPHQLNPRGEAKKKSGATIAQAGPSPTGNR